MLVISIVLLVALLAFANGANDNCKGVATLVGFGAATPRRAMIWATVTTAVGAAVSFWLSAGLIKTFSTGLFANGTVLDGGFFVAVLSGAIGWVMFATFTGLPVSTTHAITGALLGTGGAALGMGQIHWAELLTKFALPLILSPVLSLVLVYLIGWPVVWAVRRYGDRCVCVVENAEAVEAIEPVGGAAIAARGSSIGSGGGVGVDFGTVTECADKSPTVVASTSAVANAVHWFSGGLVGFARGWNDAPKIAGLCIGTLGAAQVSGGAAIAFTVVTVAMAAGGLVAGRRVLETLSKRVTPLPLAESLTASVTTAVLVGTASWVSLPVSTTHVSTGAIVGAGIRNDPRAVRWGKVGEIVLSWLVTVPVAALIAGAVYFILLRVLPT